jgi:hypothetical protein
VVSDANAVPLNPEMSNPTRSLVSTPRDPTGKRVPVFGETGRSPVTGTRGPMEPGAVLSKEKISLLGRDTFQQAGNSFGRL